MICFGKSLTFAQHTCSITCFNCAFKIEMVWFASVFAKCRNTVHKRPAHKGEISATPKTLATSGPERTPLSIMIVSLPLYFSTIGGNVFIVDCPHPVACRHDWKR